MMKRAENAGSRIQFAAGIARGIGVERRHFLGDRVTRVRHRTLELFIRQKVDLGHCDSSPVCAGPRPGRRMGQPLLRRDCYGAHKANSESIWVDYSRSLPR